LSFVSLALVKIFLDRHNLSKQRKVNKIKAFKNWRMSLIAFERSILCKMKAKPLFSARQDDALFPAKDFHFYHKFLSFMRMLYTAFILIFQLLANSNRIRISNAPIIELKS
jgi:hypothetical protein